MNSSIQGRSFTIAPSYIYSIIELLSLFFNLLFIVICMGISLACMSVHHMCTVPMEARRASDPLGQQLTGMWVLRINPGSFGRELPLLTTDQSIAPIPELLFLILGSGITYPHYALLACSYLNIHTIAPTRKPLNVLQKLIMHMQII